MRAAQVVVALLAVSPLLVLLLSVKEGCCSPHNHHGHHQQRQKHHHHHNQHHPSNNTNASHHRRRHSSPRGCFRCPPGWGVEAECTSTEDTRCRPCVDGESYSAHHSFVHSCLSCSLCGEGLYVAHPCSPTSDTVCDSCSTYRGPHNEDFRRKCESFGHGEKEDEFEGEEDKKVFASGSSVDDGALTTVVFNISSAPDEEVEVNDNDIKNETKFVRLSFDDSGQATAEILTTTELPDVKQSVPDDASERAIVNESTSSTQDGSLVRAPMENSIGNSAKGRLSSDGGQNYVSKAINNKKTLAKTPTVEASQQNPTSDANKLDELTSLMARETWDHSQENFEQSPAVAFVLSRALTSHDEKMSVTNFTDGRGQTGSLSAFEKRMAEWHNLNASNTFKVTVVVLVTCSAVLSVFWVVVQCKKASNWVAYETLVYSEDHV